jgi:hypothetical protein
MILEPKTRDVPPELKTGSKSIRECIQGLHLKSTGIFYKKHGFPGPQTESVLEEVKTQ